MTVKKKESTTFGITLPNHLVQRIDSVRERLCLSRASLIRLALVEWITGKEKDNG